MHYETEMYQPPTPPSVSTIPDDSRLGTAFRVITWCVLGIVMVVWGVVGFIFWLPLMLRETARFSVSLVQSAMTGADLGAEGERLKEAVDFYKRGFELAYSAVMKTEPRTSSRPSVPINGKFLVNQALWAALVWWLLLSLIGATDLTPFAIVRWFTSGAWLQTLDGLAVTFWGWLDSLTGAATGT